MFSRMDEYYDEYHQVKTTTTVVPDDVWKKFDLEEVLDLYPGNCARNDLVNDFTDEAFPSWPPYSQKNSQERTMILKDRQFSSAVSIDKFGNQDVREIRNHDCMWAGLCIAREHNRTCTKKSYAPSSVPAGRSLLITKNNNVDDSSSNNAGSNHSSSCGNNTTSSASSRLTQPMAETNSSHRNSNYYSNCRATAGKTKSLESDGDSTRPGTPQSKKSSEASETETEESSDDEANVNDMPVCFSHDQIDIATMISSRPSEVTGQKYWRRQQQQQQLQQQKIADNVRIKEEPGSPVGKNNYLTSDIRSINDEDEEEDEEDDEDDGNESGIEIKNEIDISPEFKTECMSDSSTDTNTHLMSDHCYHLNQQPLKRLDHLGVQTPSDSGESEEEIDVVNLKPGKPGSSALALLNTPDHHFHFNQLTVNSLSAYKERKKNNDIENVVPVSSITQIQTTGPRPRGRPPLNPANRKRQASNSALTNAADKQAKRPRTNNVGRPPSNGYARKNQQRQHQQRHLSHYQHHHRRRRRPHPQDSGPQYITASSLANRNNCSSEDEEPEPDTEKRSLHNNMERQRRVELRQAFEELRLLVPAVQDKEKAPKVAILKQSAQYCLKLTETNTKYYQEFNKLKRQQAYFRERLRILRVDHSKNQGR